MSRVAVVVLIGASCGKQLNADYCAAHATDDRCVGRDGGAADGISNDGALIDAPMATRIYVGTTSGELWAINTVAMTQTKVGDILDPVGGSPMPIDGLGYLPQGVLIAITSSEHLIQIDPATAEVMTRAPMAESHDYYGVAVVPPGELGPSAMVLAAAQDTARLYEVNVDDRTLRDIGSFGGGLEVAGDIAWLAGVGLFASVQGSGCSGTCIASLSPTTGQATLLAATGPGDMWALAAFGGQLWAVGGSSDAYTVNHTTGATTLSFDTSISGVSDAAP